MSRDIRSEGGTQQHPGRITVTGRALQNLTVGLVRDGARVPAREVSVSLSDDSGKLKASITLPVVLGIRSVGTLSDRAAELRRKLVEGMASMAGRELSSVDIRFSGIRSDRERRVS